MPITILVIEKPPSYNGMTEVVFMYFHASNVEGIKRLVPNVSSHNKPLVYFTTKRENSLVYLTNAVEKYLYLWILIRPLSAASIKAE